MNTRFLKFFLTLFSCAALFSAFGLDIQLPPETAAFKQDNSAEFANGQCLTCHSVEYVIM